MALGARIAGFVRRGMPVAIGGVTAAILFTGAIATAKSDYASPYGYDKTWNAALRMVRVDLGFKVLEKDEANGYLLFEYRSPESGPKATNASFEFVRPAGGAGDVKVVAQIVAMPRYHEQVLLDDLTKKMHDDYGDPPAARKEAPPAPPPDAGTDASDDENN
jgi:hypothetical protein